MSVTVSNLAPQIISVSDSLLAGAEARTFKTQMSRLIRDHSCLLLDLTQLEFIDADGLASLAWSVQKTLEHQGTITFCIASPSVLALLEMTGIADTVAIYPTIREALETLSFAELYMQPTSRSRLV